MSQKFYFMTAMTLFYVVIMGIRHIEITHCQNIFQHNHCLLRINNILYIFKVTQSF